MQPDIRPAKELCVLYESIEAHAQTLRQMLAHPPALDDLRLEVKTINGLLAAFTYASEVAQQMLGCSNAKGKREQMRAALKTLRVRGIIEGREPLVELRDLSNRTICRTLALQKQAEQLISQATDNDKVYAHPPLKKAFAMAARA